MALQKDYKIPDIGAAFAGAYHRILRVEQNYAAGSGQVVVGVYVDADARQDGKRAMRELAFAVAITEPVDRAALYAALKALPEYAGATDV